MAGNWGSMIVCLFVVAIFLSISPSQSSEQLSAYDMLEEFGFPRGLLPSNVQRYILDNSDGSFVVYLDGACSFEVESGYRLKYRSEISGRIRKGSVSKLNGISVKVLFFWLTIDQVVANGDNLEFYVGPLSANFPVSNFYVIAQCGCGLNCGYQLVAQS